MSRVRVSRVRLSRVRLGPVIALLVGLSAPAVAADLSRPGYLPAPVFSWTKLYLGVNGGYGWASAGGLSMDGAFGGGQLGYNYQTGFWVFGFEGDFEGANFSQSFTNAAGFGTSTIHELGTARARIGVAANTVLFYGTAGAAWVRNEVTVTTPALNFSSTPWSTGWVAGGGIEWAFLPNFTAKVEYLHYGLESQNYFGVLNNTNLAIDTVKVGLNYLLPN